MSYYIYRKMPSKKKTRVKKMSRAKLYKQVLILSKILNIEPSYYKTRYRGSTSDYWLKERNALRYALLQRYRNKKQKQKHPFFLTDLMLSTYKNKHETMRQGDFEMSNFYLLRLVF